MKFQFSNKKFFQPKCQQQKNKKFVSIFQEIGWKFEHTFSMPSIKFIKQTIFVLDLSTVKFPFFPGYPFVKAS
jgi:hypothetical protein